MMPEVPVSNKRSKYIFWGAIVLIFIFLGGNIYLWSHIGRSSQTNSPQAQPSPLPKEATVTLGKDGFSPNTVTIAQNSAVRWINSSDTLATVNSDDHPNHQKFRELNLGNFGNGASLVHIFTTPGTFTYHNHLKPEEKGTIIVK